LRLSKSVVVWVLLVGFYAPHSQAQTATISWNNVDQVIDGFGAATNGRSLTPEQIAFFFSPGTGDLGLSLLRTVVPDDGSCSTVNAVCAGEVNNMRLAIANGARVWSTPWSPPASMKTNGSTICNTGTGTPSPGEPSGSLGRGSYPAYAAYLANYIQSLSSLYGIHLYALSVQNEPDVCPTYYDGAIWSAANLHDFIRNNLGPAFVSEGLTSTLIMMPESSAYGTLASLADTTMQDPEAAAYVGINAWHDYDDAASVINPYAAQNKRYWETEVSALPGIGPSLCAGCWDPSIADALLWAQIVDNRMAVANANAWNWWVVIGDTNNDNAALIGPDQTTIPKRAYMLGNYSKFVRPGFYRIEATHAPQNGILVSAYKNPSNGSLVIVVINQNSLSTPQRFTLDGTTVSSMTPWVTSANLNLIQQSDVAASRGSFAYSLAPLSITSFVGNITASAVSPAPMPPARLAAAVK
jgi:glucuronoarabinoxylan endo-1,4-beta-xylanase